MKRWLFGGAGVLFALTAFLVLVTLVGQQTPSAIAQPTTMYLDLQPVGGKVTSAAVPANCSTWHELYPNNCVPHHQTAYVDADGDSTISACDYIDLDDIRYHITWVGPTYFLDCQGEGSALHSEDPTGGDPTCETWHEIYPNWCTSHHVDGWGDNGDSLLSPCDIVSLDGQECHIVDIGLDIIVEPGGPTATERSTWGKVKNLFRDVF